ncbi:MAG: hypothetical protein ACRD8U_07015 [Pyrinomonadaceae bacterium]
MPICSAKFSTGAVKLFAIKKPLDPPGYNLEFVSLHDVFASYVSPWAGHSCSGTVVVESAKTGKRQETPMPHFALPGKPLNVSTLALVSKPAFAKFSLLDGRTGRMRAKIRPQWRLTLLI